MSIVIIDYGSGNLHSIAKAVEKQSIGKEILVSNKAADLKNSSHIILPGVGAFADCMAGLKNIPEMIEELSRQVLEKKKHFLGICVGMQLLAEKGLEDGEHQGLGWIKANVVKIKPNDQSLKIPHMGWNNLNIKKDHKIFAGIKNGDHVYFVHSYHMECKENKDIAATVDYGCEITALIILQNIIGTQFHPEKSGETGLKLINNFLCL